MAMCRRLPLLAESRIAEPCDADWDAMAGSERVRWCGRCARDVHDFTRMTGAEAEALLTRRAGRVCVRLIEVVAVAATLAACEPKPPRSPEMQLDVFDSPVPGPVRNDPVFDRTVQRVYRRRFVMGRL
jgi:hypothetical protein